MIRKLFILTFFTLSGSLMIGQTSWETALAKGDVDALSSDFAKKMELSVLGKEGTFVKDEVLVILRDFFAGNDVKGFRRMHAGASKGQVSNYTIGQLATGNGTFRVYLYFDVYEDKRLISEIRIEHPN